MLSILFADDCSVLSRILPTPFIRIIRTWGLDYPKTWLPGHKTRLSSLRIFVTKITHISKTHGELFTKFDYPLYKTTQISKLFIQLTGWYFIRQKIKKSECIRILFKSILFLKSSVLDYPYKDYVIEMVIRLTVVVLEIKFRKTITKYNYHMRFKSFFAPKISKNKGLFLINYPFVYSIIRVYSSDYLYHI